MYLELRLPLRDLRKSSHHSCATAALAVGVAKHIDVRHIFRFDTEIGVLEDRNAARERLRPCAIAGDLFAGILGSLDPAVVNRFCWDADGAVLDMQMRP